MQTADVPQPDGCLTRAFLSLRGRSASVPQEMLSTGGERTRGRRGTGGGELLEGVTEGHQKLPLCPPSPVTN